MKNSSLNSANKLAKIASQFLVIIGLFTFFFVTAKNSEMYQVWGGEITKIVRRGSKVAIALLLITFVVWIFLLYKSKIEIKINIPVVIGMGMMIIIHYLVRIQMIPSYQTEDGGIYYMFLNKLINKPELLLEDFFNGGKLASHIAHGYIFFASMGEFLIPGTRFGFQWPMMFLGIGAACCLYGIFLKLFPKQNKLVLWMAAFIVSVQPMFLGLSTYCNLEYGLTAFFIYAFYCYINRKYILLAFWLLILGTTKETGVMMAIVFVGAIVISELVFFIREKGLKNLIKKIDAKWIIVLVIMTIGLAFLAYKILNMQVWGGYVLKDVISFGGEGTTMTFRFNPWSLKIKLAQLFVLNFSWISATIVVIGIIYMIVSRIKGKQRCEEDKIPFKPLCALLVCYSVYTFFLLFYQEAKQIRYNMLSDVVFLMLTMFLVVKLLKQLKVLIPLLTICGSLFFVEAFVTIDFMTTALFTNIETNRLPMVFTLFFKDEKEVLNNNAGDYAFYNYQYTFMDRAIDKMLRDLGTGGVQWVFSASDTYETQFIHDNLRWDIVEGKRCYEDDPTRYLYIDRENVFEFMERGAELPQRAVLMESPWCKSPDWDKAIEVLAQYYDMTGPCEADEGAAGTIIYYLLELK